MTRRTSGAPLGQTSQQPPIGPRLADAIAASPEGALLAVMVVPKAGANAVDGVVDETVRVRVTAPPVDGAANAALVRFLADRVGLPKGRVRIVAGQTSRRKRVLFVGLVPEALAERLHRPR